MATKNIEEMLYAEFSQKFSVEIPEESKINDFYTTTNEKSFNKIIENIKSEKSNSRIHYMGIIGGVDMDFNYISNLSPEHSFLFDISNKAVAYLGLRLCLLMESNNISDYYLNMLVAKPEEHLKFRSAISNKDFFENIRMHRPDEKYIASQRERFKQMLGYSSNSEELSTILGDPDFRKNATAACSRYLDKMHDNGELEQSWVVTRNLLRLNHMAKDNRIRGFTADLINGFQKSAETLINNYGIRNLVLYTSNVHERLPRTVATKDSPVIYNRAYRSIVESLANKLDKLWVIDSKFSENRILAGKGIKLENARINNGVQWSNG